MVPTLTSCLAGSSGTFDLDYDLGVGVFLLLREHDRRDHTDLVFRDLGRDVSRDVLPPGVAVLQAGDLRGGTFVLGDAGGAVVLLRTCTGSANVVVSAASSDAARSVADAVMARVPPAPDDGRVKVRFSDAEHAVRTRRIAARPWDEIAPLYPAAVSAALGTVMAHRAAADESRRLLVWYGPPGNGKTTAAGALLRAWREWADGVVVTDPERLLTDGRYLRRLVLDENDGDRWRLYVLEDAESLLHTTVRATSALGKLLNLADGMLGQGLRCLFLLTTNEPVAALHPALVRPGRCLARIEFAALSAAETARVLGRPVDRGQTVAEVLAARAVSTSSAPAAVGQYL